MNSTMFYPHVNITEIDFTIDLKEKKRNSNSILMKD